MGVKIEVFDLFSYFGLYFLAESVFLDGFHAKDFIIWGFVEFQFFVFGKWHILLKNGCGALFNFMRKFYLKTFCKDYNTDCYYYLDLKRKFELCSLIDSTVILFFVFEKTFPLKCALRKVRRPLYKLNGRQIAHFKWALWAKYQRKRAEISWTCQSCDSLSGW